MPYDGGSVWQHWMLCRMAGCAIPRDGGGVWQQDVHEAVAAYYSMGEEPGMEPMQQEQHQHQQTGVYTALG